MTFLRPSPYQMATGDKAEDGRKATESYEPARGAVEANGGRNYEPVAIRVDGQSAHEVSQGDLVIASIVVVPEGGAPGEVVSADQSQIAVADGELQPVDLGEGEYPVVKMDEPTVEPVDTRTPESAGGTTESYEPEATPAGAAVEDTPVVTEDDEYAALLPDGNYGALL